MRARSPRRATVLLLLLLAFNACDAGAASTPAQDFAAPNAEGFGRAAGLVYFEEVVGNASAADRLPLIVLLHGRGDRPRPQYLPLALPRSVRVIMPRAPEPFGEDGYSWFTYRANQASSDQLARAIDSAAERVAAAIEVLRARRPTLGAPIVGGFSQGGMISYALAVGHPKLLQIVLPLGGLLPEALWPKRALPKPGQAPKIRAAHGTRDTLVPFARARATATALAERGYDVTLLEEDGVAHAISPRMVEMLNRELAAALEAMPGK
jgi:phospholipase/carboxylesterase